jgi:hypothetical protein
VDAGDRVPEPEYEEDMEISFEKRFGWYVVLNRVANDDITRHDEIFNKTILSVLNQLSYIIEKDKEMVRRSKEQMKTQ